MNFPDGNYEFQQDGAKSHGVKMTQQFLKDNMAKLWAKGVWPTSSPDLNLLNYSIWSVVESTACKKAHSSLSNHLLQEVGALCQVLARPSVHVKWLSLKKTDI